jgi:nicotinate phosphoribosyltransferase
VSIGGRKFALRRLDDAGVAEAEVIGLGAPPAGDHNDRPLLVPLVTDGRVADEEPLQVARDRHLSRRAELPQEALKMSRGEPVIETIFVERDGDQSVNPYATTEARGTR